MRRADADDHELAAAATDNRKLEAKHEEIGIEVGDLSLQVRTRATSDARSTSTFEKH